jgi:hypothetical protein
MRSKSHKIASPHTHTQYIIYNFFLLQFNLILKNK